LNSGLAADRRSRDEVADAIRALTPAQSIRLRKIAARLAFGKPVEPDDLLQKAFVSAIEEDGRKCPKDVDIVRFLAEAMRSIADGEVDKASRRVLLVQVPKVGGDHETEEREVEFADEQPNAEQRYIDHERAVEMQNALLALFADDQTACELVEGIMAEMTAEELRQLTDLDETAYKSKRKLIRRRIDAAFPKGLRP